MTYVSVAWAFAPCKTRMQKLQTFQNKFLRQAFNAPWFVRNNQLHREVKMPTMEEFFRETMQEAKDGSLVIKNAFSLRSSKWALLRFHQMDHFGGIPGAPSSFSGAMQPGMAAQRAFRDEGPMVPIPKVTRGVLVSIVGLHIYRPSPT
ncbi:hypothetical protein TcasGA2_TC008529 [Tribolium castaneum]|uniref:Uncharacterized protein n=1 Tax=Tribolium castaneum TaxID=7070 RepID=D7EI94_TRICA|nr:hypothetical protein TcasGA2_TC008529 [Tribolium castaneum]